MNSFEESSMLKSFVTLKASLLLKLILTLSASQSWAWGERGHHIIGYTAAQLAEDFLTIKEREDMGSFFSARKIMMGHLNNIPDISWKDSRLTLINKLNGPTHYFDTELIIGAPGDDLISYQDKIRKLDTDFSRFMAMHNNKPNKLDSSKNLKIFADAGSAPFRVGQLYQKMVEAFKCANGKKNPAKPKQFVEPIRNGDYKCTDKTSRTEDLAAAVEIGGVLGHFIADLAQPMHTTIDYDGYSVGQGGVHLYFETLAIGNMDDKLNDDVKSKARESEFQKNLWDSLKLPSQNSFDGTKTAFHLIANSIVLLKPLYELDKKYAVINTGTTLPFGTRKKNTDKEAVRRPASDPQVLQGFRTFAVERMAVGSLVLARLWVQAWREGGSPMIKDLVHYSYPYPMNVPFILPQQAFIKETLKPDEIRKLKKFLK
jgi:hypothetical protein